MLKALLYVIFIASITTKSFKPLNCNTGFYKQETSITKILEVSPGDTLINLLTKNDVKQNDAYTVIKSLKKVYNVNKIDKGTLIEIRFDNYLGTFEGIRLLDKHGKGFSINKDHEGVFITDQTENHYTKTMIKISDTINGSFFTSALAQGMPSHLIMHAIDIYKKNNINLDKDIKQGSDFEILYEGFLDASGNIVKHGKLTYLNIPLKNKDLKLYLYVTKNGKEQYFDSNGLSYTQSHEPMFKSPVAEGARISSKFGMRTHPISGKKQLHKGVDFAVGHGKPIYATADGIVEFVGTKGSYGKYIKIRHKDKYHTAYAHLSKYKTGLKAGQKIKQGELLAYSGKTGKVTGPHLHYELWHNNKPIDPLKVTYAKHSTTILSKRELNEFNRDVQRINNIIHGIEYASNKNIPDENNEENLISTPPYPSHKKIS